MPRRARLDAAGAFHHIIVGDQPFGDLRDNKDQQEFPDRLVKRYQSRYVGHDFDAQHIERDDGKQMRYRRSQTPGATYFFTVVTYERKKMLCLEENPRLMRQAFDTVKAKYPFIVDAIVLLPDHLHCLWTLPRDDNEK